MGVLDGLDSALAMPMKGIVTLNLHHFNSQKGYIMGKSGQGNSAKSGQGSSSLTSGSIDSKSGKSGIMQTQGAHTMKESLKVPAPKAALK